MSVTKRIQCPNCSGWYSHLKGFRHHLRHCRTSNDASSLDVRRLMYHDEPRLSIHSSSDIFSSNDRSVLSDDDFSYSWGELRQSVVPDNNNRKEDDSDFCSLRRKTSPITKFQVMLNDLLIKHKASLLLYDQIIDLVSTYISTPGFN